MNHLSQSEVLGAERRDEIDADPEGPTERLEFGLASKLTPDPFGLVQTVVDLHKVHADHPPFVREPPHDVHRLPPTQSVAETGAGLSSGLGVDGVDIEGEVEGACPLRVQVLHALPHHLPDPELIHVVHRVAPHSVLRQSHVLVVVDIADRDEDHVLGVEVGVVSEPLPGGEGREGDHAGHVRERHPVVVVAERGVGTPQTVVYRVRMRVHPDQSQVLVEPESRGDGRSADRVVAADRQQQVGLPAGEGLEGALVQPAEERAEDLRVPDGELHWREAVFLLSREDVPEVLHRNAVVPRQQLEDPRTADQRGTALHPADGLTVMDCSAEKAQSFEDGLLPAHHSKNIILYQQIVRFSERGREGGGGRGEEKMQGLFCHPSKQYFSYHCGMSKVNPAFLYPPDPEKALRHRRANQIFKGLTASDTDSCECCGRKLGSEAVSPSCLMNPDQLSFLGPGVPLFFFYLRAAILLLLAMAVIFAAFATYSNLATNDCPSLRVCSSNVLDLMALINKRSSELYFTLQGYLELAFIVVVLVFFQWVRLAGRKLEKLCDEVIDSPSDYAVILRRLPPGTTEKDVEQMIEQRRRELTEEEMKQTENLKVVKVILSYSLKEYLSVGAQNTENFKAAIKNGSHGAFLAQPQPHPAVPSSIAIVVFEHQASKALLVHHPSAFQRLLQALCTPCIPISPLTVRGERVGVERAPEPDDICWENSGITMGGGIGRKVLYGSIAFVILLVGGAAQYGLEMLYNATSDSSLQTFLTLSNSFVVLVFNSIIMLTLIATTKKQRNETLTEYQSVLMTKQTIFQFFNAGVFVIAAEVAAQSQRFSLNDGLCLQISAVMLANCFVPSLTLMLLNYTEIVNKIYLLLGEQGCAEYTQKEMNELYLGPEVDLPSKYAYILKIVWLTGLYAPLVPIVVVVAALGLTLNYLFEKLLFAKSYSLPNTVSSQTYENAVELLEYFLIAFAMGQAIVYLYFYSYQVEAVPAKILAPILASLALGALNVLLPMSAINEALFPLPESAKSAVKYSEIEEKFEVTYEMNNPACRSERERRNVKDILGLGVGDGAKEVAIEITNLFMGSGKGAGKEPLLKDSATKEQKPYKLNAGEVRQTHQGIFTTILRNQNKGSAGIGLKEYSAISKDIGSQRRGTIASAKERGSPQVTESKGSDRSPEGKGISMTNSLILDQPVQNGRNDPPSQSQNPPRANPAGNKSSLPSASTANDSLLKRSITNPPLQRSSFTERQEEVVEGEDGEKINISVHEPPELKKGKKGTAKALVIDSQEAIPVPVPVNASNSSTKYKKPPQKAQFVFPSTNRPNPLDAQKKVKAQPPARPLQAEPSVRLLPKPVQKQRIPWGNSFEEAPIAIKRPPEPTPAPAPSLLPSNTPSQKNGLYSPLSRNQQFKFQDPTKQQSSQYNPHLLHHSPEIASQKKSYLNPEGVMKALGRPFTSFVKKMGVEGMTERAGKAEKK